MLDINYRNTAQIVNFARRLVAGDEYSDIEGVLARGDVPSSVPRVGAEPIIARCANRRELNETMISHVRSVTKDISTGIGDVAVLCITRRSSMDATAALLAAGFPVINLEEYGGVPIDAIKVGTIKRAKGLEFKQVLIPDIRREHTITEPPTDDTDRERWDLTRREFYVAMTRARDGLWVGISS